MSAYDDYNPLAFFKTGLQTIAQLNFYTSRCRKVDSLSRGFCLRG